MKSAESDQSPNTVTEIMNYYECIKFHVDTPCSRISRTVITKTLDDYSGEHPSSDVKIKDQPTDIKVLHDGTPLLHYSYPICPRCMSRDVSRNGRYLREIEKHRVMIQRYTCNNCSYSFEARPPWYTYGKHIPDHVREKTRKSRVLSSLRKTVKMCNIFLNMHISHETVRNSIPLSLLIVKGWNHPNISPTMNSMFPLMA